MTGNRGRDSRSYGHASKAGKIQDAFMSDVFLLSLVGTKLCGLTSLSHDRTDLKCRTRKQPISADEVWAS